MTIYPQRGALVRELSSSGVHEAAQVRYALEMAGVLQGRPATRVDLAAHIPG